MGSRSWSGWVTGSLIVLHTGPAGASEAADQAPEGLLSVGQGWSVGVENLQLSYYSFSEDNQSRRTQGAIVGDWFDAREHPDTGRFLQLEARTNWYHDVDMDPGEEDDITSSYGQAMAVRGDRRRYLRGDTFFLHTGALTTLDWSYQDQATQELTTGLHPLAGVGTGRILHNGETARLGWVEEVLLADGCLQGPLPATTASKIRWAWYVLRSEIGGAQRLQALLAILTEDDLLVAEPSTMAAYKVINLLRAYGTAGRWSGSQLSFDLGYDLMTLRDAEDPQGLRAQATWAYERPLGRLDQLALRQQIVSQFDALDIPVTVLATRSSASWTHDFHNDTLDYLGSVSLGASLTWGATLGSTDAAIVIHDRWLTTGDYEILGDGPLLDASISARTTYALSQVTRLTLYSSASHERLGSDEPITRFWLSLGLTIGRTDGFYATP
jgi:hypothetical protein